MLSCSSQHLSFSRSGALLLLLLPPPRLLLLRRGFLLRAWTTFAVLKKRRYCRASFEPLLCCPVSTFLFRIPDAHCLVFLAGIFFLYFFYSDMFLGELMVKFFEKISGLSRAGSWVVVPELAW